MYLLRSVINQPKPEALVLSQHGPRQGSSSWLIIGEAVLFVIFAEEAGDWWRWSSHWRLLLLLVAQSYCFRWSSSAGAASSDGGSLVVFARLSELAITIHLLEFRGCSPSLTAVGWGKERGERSRGGDGGKERRYRKRWQILRVEKGEEENQNILGFWFL